MENLFKAFAEELEERKLEKAKVDEYKSPKGKRIAREERRVAEAVSKPKPIDKRFEEYKQKKVESEMEKDEKDLRKNMKRNKEKEKRQAQERQKKTQQLADKTRRTSRQPNKHAKSGIPLPSEGRLSPEQHKTFMDHGIIKPGDPQSVKKPDKAFVPKEKPNKEPVQRGHLRVIKADLVKALMDRGLYQSARDLYAWGVKDSLAKSVEEELTKGMFSEKDQAKYEAHKEKIKQQNEKARRTPGIVSIDAPQKEVKQQNVNYKGSPKVTANKQARLDQERSAQNKASGKNKLDDKTLKEIEARGNSGKVSNQQKIINNALKVGQEYRQKQQTKKEKAKVIEKLAPNTPNPKIKTRKKKVEDE